MSSSDEQGHAWHAACWVPIPDSALRQAIRRERFRTSDEVVVDVLSVACSGCRAEYRDSRADESCPARERTPATWLTGGDNRRDPSRPRRRTA